MNRNVIHSSLRLATAQESRLIDERTIKELSLRGETLMEIAGNRAAECIMEDYLPGASVLFLCGKGNNAGDALVIARILLDRGYHVHLYPVFGLNELSPDAEINVHRLNTMADLHGVNVTVWESWKSDETIDLLVDGLFGTGLSRGIDGIPAKAISSANASGIPIYALDIPSGLHCDTGEAEGAVIQAKKTIQFGVRKFGCYLGHGISCSGERVLVDLPFPEAFKKGMNRVLIDPSMDPVQKLTSETRVEPSEKLHKYNNGVVHVIGGSSGLTGAPYYSAKASWSLGMGAVFLHTPAAWLSVMDVLAPEIIKKPGGSADDEFFTSEHSEEVLSVLDQKPGVVILGPGLGRKEETKTFVRQIIEHSSCPVILDADALAALPGYFHLISEKEHPENILLTPHSGELAMLTDHHATTDYERMEQTKELAHALGCCVLSKGNPVIAYHPETHTSLLTSYDISVFSRAGFGDVLCGHIAAFSARSSTLFSGCEPGLLYGYKKIMTRIQEGQQFPGPSDIL
ncbi:NAD(P)H-hydrate epimerase [Balneolaceae bacterium ANBcel3]|nr:NAD(P)H-hydrate epimerase [Balneolaceae bacterium ANBcel3]